MASLKMILIEFVLAVEDNEQRLLGNIDCMRRESGEMRADTRRSSGDADLEPAEK